MSLVEFLKANYMGREVKSLIEEYTKKKKITINKDVKVRTMYGFLRIDYILIANGERLAIGVNSTQRAKKAFLLSEMSYRGYKNLYVLEEKPFKPEKNVNYLILPRNKYGYPEHLVKFCDEFKVQKKRLYIRLLSLYDQWLEKHPDIEKKLYEFEVLADEKRQYFPTEIIEGLEDI